MPLIPYSDRISGRDVCDVRCIDLDRAGDRGQTAVGVDAGVVVPGVCDGDDFVRVGLADELFKAGFYRGLRADDGLREAGFYGVAFPRLPKTFHGIDGWQRLDRLIADESEETLLRRGEEALGGRVGFSGDEGDGDDEVRLLQGRIGLEVFQIDLRGCVERLRREVRGEGEGQALRSSQRGAVCAGSEKGDGDVASLPRKGVDALAGAGWAEVALQLTEEGREIVAVLVEISAECAHCREIAAGSAAQAEVYAVGIQRFERSKLFGDDQRGMVGEHDASAAHADCGGGGGDVADQHRSRGAGEAGDGVMFGEPVARVAEALDVAGKVGRAGDSGGGRFAGVQA